MAILIHKVRKLKDKKFFSYEMTPEKNFQLRKKSLTFVLDSIDLNHKEDIIIVDRDTPLQKDLKTYLNVLDYKNVHCIDNANDLFSYLRGKKFVTNSSIFCFCDYTMLLLPDWNFLNEKMKKIGIDFSIIAILPGESHQRLTKIYNTKIIGTIAKPIRLTSLRKILYKYLGPPLKKIAQ